jgi:hypothetical protein
MRLLARHPQEGTAWEDAYKQCVARQGTVGSGLNASWADVVPQRKSSLSYLIFCNNAVFSWKSSLSSVLAMSSAEAELIALCACAADVAYCRKLANEFGFLQLRPTSFTRIMCVAGFNLSGFNLSVSVSVSEYFRFSIFRFSIRRRYRLR